MKSRRYYAILKPDITALGYALFIAINAAGVWGGVFPFLPESFQTTQILSSFFLWQSLVFMLVYFVSVLGVYFLPGPTRRFMVIATATPYFLGWCALIGAIYFSERALFLVSIGGALLGIGSAGFFMLWQRLFASQNSDTGNRDLILGTAYGSLFYFALYLIPVAITSILIPLVFMPLFCLCIVLKSRTIDLEQPMFQDKPRNNSRVYRQLLHDYWRSALCIGALGFCSGVVRALAIGDVEIGSLVNIMSMGGSLTMALALLFVWQIKNLRINIVVAYRVFFPFIITGFMILPLVKENYSALFASLIYAVYSCGIILMMIQCAQASRDRGINPIFIYGFIGGIVYALHDIGFIGGMFIERLDIMGLGSTVIVTLFALYLLGLMYFIGNGGFRQAFVQRSLGAEHIELVALNVPQKNKMLDSEDDENEEQNVRDISSPLTPLYNLGRLSNTERRDAAHVNLPQYRDRISKQCALLQQHYRLSAREAEVMELIARGNNVTRIAEVLVVSENTVRTHSKRIYTKLAIHKKQELLDLINEFSPKNLNT